MNLLKSSCLWLSLLLSACATVPPDVPICTELSMTRGFCTNTISDKSFFIDEEIKLEGKTWWELRPTMIQVPISSWVKIKAFIIKVCKEKGNCGDNISNWERRVFDLDQQIQLKGLP